MSFLYMCDLSVEILHFLFYSISFWIQSNSYAMLLGNFERVVRKTYTQKCLEWYGKKEIFRLPTLFISVRKLSFIKKLNVYILAQLVLIFIGHLYVGIQTNRYQTKSSIEQASMLKT